MQLGCARKCCKTSSKGCFCRVNLFTSIFSWTFQKTALSATSVETELRFSRNQTNHTMVANSIASTCAQSSVCLWSLMAKQTSNKWLFLPHFCPKQVRGNRSYRKVFGSYIIKQLTASSDLFLVLASEIWTAILFEFGGHCPTFPEDEHSGGTNVIFFVPTIFNDWKINWLWKLTTRTHAAN